MKTQGSPRVPQSGSQRDQMDSTEYIWVPKATLKVTKICKYAFMAFNCNLIGYNVYGCINIYIYIYIYPPPCLHGSVTSSSSPPAQFPTPVHIPTAHLPTIPPTVPPASSLQPPAALSCFMGTPPLRFLLAARASSWQLQASAANTFFP